jgi:hypothetical protein
VSWELRRAREGEGSDGQWEMVVSADVDIPRGTEVFLSYGPRGNDVFLLHYGFLPLGNPVSQVLLQFGSYRFETHLRVH